MKCPNCKNDISTNDKYCKYCGYTLPKNVETDSEKGIYIYFAICMIFIVLSFCTSFLPAFFSIVLYVLSIIFLIIMSIVTLILAIIYRKNKKKLLIYLITLFLFIIYICFSYTPYNVIHSRNEIKKYMKDNFTSAKYNIKRIAMKNEKKESYRCDYIFDVSLDDNSDITFQAGYCDTGTMWTDYNVITNYSSYYFPYYLKKFNIQNNTNLNIQSQLDDNYLNDTPKIMFSSNEEFEQIKSFIESLKSYSLNTNNKIIISSTNNDYNETVSLWIK